MHKSKKGTVKIVIELTNGRKVENIIEDTTICSIHMALIEMADKTFVQANEDAETNGDYSTQSDPTQIYLLGQHPARHHRQCDARQNILHIQTKRQDILAGHVLQKPLAF